MRWSYGNNCNTAGELFLYCLFSLFAMYASLDPDEWRLTTNDRAFLSCLECWFDGCCGWVTSGLVTNHPLHVHWSKWDSEMAVATPRRMITICSALFHSQFTTYKSYPMLWNQPDRGYSSSSKCTVCKQKRNRALLRGADLATSSSSLWSRIVIDPHQNELRISIISCYEVRSRLPLKPSFGLRRSRTWNMFFQKTLGLLKEFCYFLS